MLHEQENAEQFLYQYASTFLVPASLQKIESNYFEHKMMEYSTQRLSQQMLDALDYIFVDRDYVEEAFYDADDAINIAVDSHAKDVYTTSAKSSTPTTISTKSSRLPSSQGTRAKQTLPTTIATTSKPSNTPTTTTNNNTNNTNNTSVPSKASTKTKSKPLPQENPLLQIEKQIEEEKKLFEKQKNQLKGKEYTYENGQLLLIEKCKALPSNTTNIKVNISSSNNNSTIATSVVSTTSNNVPKQKKTSDSSSTSAFVKPLSLQQPMIDPKMTASAGVIIKDGKKVIKGEEIPLQKRKPTLKDDSHGNNNNNSKCKQPLSVTFE